jgi:hypothetical protein
VAEEQSPFADVRDEDGGFSLPQLKWRELLFIGAIRREGEHYIRDPLRPMPPFARSGLFPDERRLAATLQGSRVVLRYLS